MYGAPQMGDDGIYLGIVVINWNDSVSQSLALDFMLIGATNSVNKYCEVTDLWTGRFIGKYKGIFPVPTLAPHDNAALKIKCTLAYESP